MIEDYEEFVMSMLNTDLDDIEKTKMCVMGLAGECGELVDIYKKLYYHGHNEPLEVAWDEMGDVLFYLTALAKLHDTNLVEVMQINMDKLKRRYPDGFDPERSKNR